MTTTTSTHLCGSWCRHDLSPLFALYGACTCPPTWNATIPPPCAIHNPTPPGWEVVTTTYNLTIEAPEPETPDADDYTEHPITEAEPEDDPSVGHEAPEE